MDSDTLISVVTQLVSAKPFRPFTIRLSESTNRHVFSAKNVSVSANLLTLTYADGHHEFISPEYVSSIGTGVPKE